MTLFRMFYRSDRFSFKSIHFKNPISLTLTNVLQIRKYRLFVPLLMFYRFESLGFASSQNVLQIRVARFCPLTKCSTDPTALTPIFLPLVKCSTDRDALVWAAFEHCVGWLQKWWEFKYYLLKTGIALIWFCPSKTVEKKVHSQTLEERLFWLKFITKS